MVFRTFIQKLNSKPRFLTFVIAFSLVGCWANPFTHPPIECLMKLSNFICPDNDVLRRWSPAYYLLLLPESTVTISNLTNHSIVETGFVVGTVPPGPTFVNVGIDDAQPTQVPVIDGTWRYALPAKAITNTFWTYGSLHTIYAHLPYEKSNTIQVRMGTNHDTDGDGYPDLIVSASTSALSQGYAYVYRINSITKQLSTTPYSILTDGIINTYFGSRIGSGDFNGDGYADVLIGSQAYAGVIAFGGRVLAFNSRGQTGIPSQNLNTGGVADAILTGTANGGRLGSVISTADVNHDGYDDAILASPWVDNLFIFHSQGSSGLITQSTITANFTYQGVFGNDNFGNHAAVGDVNGDGFQDLIVGEHQYSSNTGRLFVFVSNQGTLPSQPQQFVYPPTDPAPGCGAGGGCRFGSSFVLDYFNSDNCIDLAVGAFSFNSNQGIAHVYHSTCDSTNPYGTVPNVTLLGPPTPSCNGNLCNFGGTLASGDTNGDGRPDLLIGATGASAGIGDVYLVLNDPITGFRNMNLSAGGSADSLFSGANAVSNFSMGLRFQDTNADGLQDIVISEPTTTNRVYTFHSVRGGVPANQNLNGSGVTSQTLAPPAGTSLGNTIAQWKTKAESYLWALVSETKKYFGMI
ncbi:FG-GAP repeat protein [Leptospira sp. 201903075]|uniref:FG-GAP-like repeat-containing protein n=1 Tax=Leptospira chreensis TaxID=2810035 RepID=UPI001964F623|nr:FG-GAP-like repeat-containing protein [Leptospira chreensis]MBM9592815.1 FG-GAP repeat protein [Leptospira chreensis]